jgi:hypothetical protein
MEAVKILTAAEPFDPGVHRDLTPEVILPSQFFGTAGARTFSSEQRLMLAVLVDAINLVLRENRDRRDFLEAWSWIFASGVARWLSFDLACDALDLNAERVRKRLSELVAERGNLARLRFREQGRRHAVTVNTSRRR